MLQLDRDLEYSDGSCFRRILHKALPHLSEPAPQYSNRGIIENRSVHPLNRLPRWKKKRKRRKKQVPASALSNPTTTVVYCTCSGQRLAPVSVPPPKPCQRLPLRTLRICLSEVSEGEKLTGEPRRTVKSVLRFVGIAFGVVYLKGAVAVEVLEAGPYLLEVIDEARHLYECRCVSEARQIGLLYRPVKIWTYLYRLIVIVCGI